MTGERILGYFVDSHLKAAGIPISAKSWISCVMRPQNEKDVAALKSLDFSDDLFNLKRRVQQCDSAVPVLGSDKISDRSHDLSLLYLDLDANDHVNIIWRF